MVGVFRRRSDPACCGRARAIFDRSTGGMVRAGRGGVGLRLGRARDRRGAGAACRWPIGPAAATCLLRVRPRRRRRFGNPERDVGAPPRMTASNRRVRFAVGQPRLCAMASDARRRRARAAGTRPGPCVRALSERLNGSRHATKSQLSQPVNVGARPRGPIPRARAARHGAPPAGATDHQPVPAMGNWLMRRATDRACSPRRATRPANAWRSRLRRRIRLSLSAAGATYDCLRTADVQP